MLITFAMLTFFLEATPDVSTARAQSIFNIDNSRPTRIVVTANDQSPTLPVISGLPEFPDSEMLRRLIGILGVLDNPDDIRPLLSAGATATPVAVDAKDRVPLCTLHLTTKQRGKRVVLSRGTDGGLFAEELDTAAETPRCVTLLPDRIEPLLHVWNRRHIGFRPQVHGNGIAFELVQPYVPGSFWMSKHTLGNRFLNRSSTSIDGTTRSLAESKFVARLPRSYDTQTPAGLLVLVSPSPGAHVPLAFEQALDELGIIAITFDSAGNATPAANRYQWAFDCIANATDRFHIDPRRIYITGMSGGGRVASILWGCFPDVFAGSVPIVGLSTYAPVPNGVGQFWPQGYVKPDSSLWRLLQTRRMGAVTGFPDFNYPEMTAAAKLMQRDKLPVRVFEYDDMGHEMPTPERFLSVLTWVDEPYRQARAKEVETADRLMREATARYKIIDPANADQRRALAAVTRAGPWTAPAWQAAELLGYHRPTPVKPVAEPLK